MTKSGTRVIFNRFCIHAEIVNKNVQILRTPDECNLMNLSGNNILSFRKRLEIMADHSSTFITCSVSRWYWR